MLDDLEHKSVSIDNNRNVFYKKFTTTIEQLIDLNITPIIVQNAPGNFRDPSRCNQVNKLAFSNQRNCDQELNYVVQKNVLANELFTRLDNSFDVLKFIPVQNLLCNGLICSTAINNNPIYYDDDHVSQAGAKLLGKKYMSEFKSNVLREHVISFYLN